ncbi:MAG: hypothetical protein P1U65_05910 [Minwuia sp.]|nr:hypothetical protein [Minwuia sp.]
MRSFIRHLSVSALLTLTLALPTGAAMADGDPVKGEKTFRKVCGQCHIPLPGDPLAAPNLVGVVGRPIASADGYRYSDAFLARKAESMIWTEENLYAFVRDPRGFIPGTVMQFVGVKRGSMRKDLIAYLKSTE